LAYEIRADGQAYPPSGLPSRARDACASDAQSELELTRLTWFSSIPGPDGLLPVNQDPQRLQREPRTVHFEEFLL